jgi:hypothetical protein
LKNRGSNTEKFFKFLNYLSQLFSIEFSQKLIKILVKYFEYHKSIVYSTTYTKIEINSDGVNLMKDLLNTDPETSHQLLKSILESNVGRLEYILNRDLNNPDFKRYNIPVGFDKIQIDSTLQYCKELASTFFKITNINQDKVFNDFELKLTSFPIKKENKSTEKKDGCFIATASMGSYDHPVVMDLRLFRDSWLLKRKWGIAFTDWYYTHGPKAAKIIEKSFLLRKITFLFLVKPLQIITKKLK